MIGNALRLALSDLIRDRTAFACQVIALASVLCPLIVLLGLKYGIVESLLSEMRERPANREIVIRGNYNLTADDLAKAKRIAGVGFVVPATRSIAARIELMNREQRSLIVGALPTDADDPLMPGGRALSAAEIAIGERVAERLRLKVGDTVEGSNFRRTAGGQEPFVLQLTVAAIVPSHLLPGDAILMPYAALGDVEAFLDGYEVKAKGIAGKPIEQRKQVFGRFRIYAKSIEDVQRVEQALKAMSLNVVSKAGEIRAIQSLDRNLGNVFMLLVAVGSIGYGLSLGTSLWSNIQRKRRTISVLRLMGLSRRSLLLFPVAQAMAIAAFGAAAAFIAFTAISSAINLMLSGTLSPAGAICQITVEHALLIVLSTLAVAIVASSASAVRLIDIPPSEVLREL